MRVWILMTGEYSDKRSVGVFLTEAKAKEVRKRYYDEDTYSIDFYPKDPFEVEVDKLVLNDRIQYWVSMELETGNDAKTIKYDSTTEDHEPVIINPNLIHNKILAYSPEHAIKILNEQRIQYL